MSIAPRLAGPFHDAVDVAMPLMDILDVSYGVDDRLQPLLADKQVIVQLLPLSLLDCIDVLIDGSPLNLRLCHQYALKGWGVECVRLDCVPLII